MTKKNTVCLRCGSVQVRTDIEDLIKGKYILLEKKRMCSRCNKNTPTIATNNIEKLRKNLEENPNRELDSYVLKLIKK